MFQIIVKIRIHHQTRSRTLYKLIYWEIFYPAFFLCACERSFETASFCLKFWLFSSRRPRKLILSIFSKSKRPFEKQTTPRLVTYLCLSMDKIWAKMIFWLWPRNFDFARFLHTFALNWTVKIRALAPKLAGTVRTLKPRLFTLNRLAKRRGLLCNLALTESPNMSGVLLAEGERALDPPFNSSKMPA